jgi:hypothetical protein
LGDGEIIPRSQTRTSDGLWYRFLESRANRIYVRSTAIDAQQQRSTERAVTHPLHQRAQQVLVTMLTDNTAQPEPGLNLYCHRYPHNQALHLHWDLIGLYLPQIARLLYYVFAYLVAVLSRPCLPTRHRAFIQTKGLHDRLDRTTIAQQRHHNDYQVRCLSQSIENGPFALCKRLAAHTALVLALLAAMDTYVSLSIRPTVELVKPRFPFPVKLPASLTGYPPERVAYPRSVRPHQGGRW